MSERVAEERVESPEEQPPSGVMLPVRKNGGPKLRIDGPDAAHQASLEVTSVPTPSVAESPNPFAEKARMLGEFGQMMLQVQQQMEELSHREHVLHQQQAEFEQEMRRFRLWATDAEADLAEKKTAQQTSESAFAQRLTDFDRQQREFDTAVERLDSDRRELEQHREELRQDLQQELEADRITLAAERQALSLQQAKVQELGDALLQQHQAQQLQIDKQLQQEREQLWITLSGEWEENRARFETEKAEFLKDQTLLENRLRFQQDHLEKTRAELERQQQLALREQQGIRTRFETAESQLQRRKRHLDHYRATLEELDRALAREQELLLRRQAALSSDAEQEYQEYLSERQAWEESRLQQQAELRRQQELLLSHTDGLEARRWRLELLRREVEETNHATLELRLAVEDVWAQLQQALGLPVAQEKVDSARRAVMHDFEQWQARLIQQRKELLDTERTIEQQRHAFQEERQTLTEWLTTRDEELLRREQQQRQHAQEQTLADRTAQSLRNKWLAEREEAEQVIRRLLSDLLNKTADLPVPDASELAGDSAAGIGW